MMSFFSFLSNFITPRLNKLVANGDFSWNTLLSKQNLDKY